MRSRLQSLNSTNQLPPPPNQTPPSRNWTHLPPNQPPSSLNQTSPLLNRRPRYWFKVQLVPCRGNQTLAEPNQLPLPCVEVLVKSISAAIVATSARGSMKRGQGEHGKKKQMLECLPCERARLGKASDPGEASGGKGPKHAQKQRRELARR